MLTLMSDVQISPVLQLGNQNAEAIQCPLEIPLRPPHSHGKSRLRCISVKFLFPLADVFDFEELVATE